MEGARVLEAIDAVVKRDGAAPRMTGRVSLGVRTAAGFRYWTADLSEARARTGFFDRLPSSDVALVMDEDTARDVLEGRAPNAPALLALEGDERLLARFFARYFARRSWLDVRAGR